MDDFISLLRPKWGSEKWILEGWEKINSEEKRLIETRMNELFKDGLPLEIKHDKTLYVYAFSLLAQLEVLAIQIPLKFQDKMVSKENKERMHQQLLDEIFHGLVFTKILYMLCDPYALPPEYNPNIELLCNTVREEECPQIAVMLLNLIAEGWIEEAFKCYAQQNIAPKVFQTILIDERRHVSDAELYRDIGLPKLSVMKKKLEYFEEQLLVNFFLQHRYIMAASALLGGEGIRSFMNSLNAKHHQQLKKINLKPSKKWIVFMQLMQNILSVFYSYLEQSEEIEMTSMRKTLMTQWDNASEATMVSQWNIDISNIDFFTKKFPPETLTTLMMQSVSLCLKENNSYRTFLHHKKLYRSKEAYVGIIVQLPDCYDHIGTIGFSNCHEMSVAELSKRIRDILPMMVYCYKKREELEQKYPHLQPYEENRLYNFAYNVYGYPFPGNFVTTISNIGPWGYTDATSPLLKNEPMKLIMMQVERKQVWNKEKQAFEIQDHLPISISADHRIFDGNRPVPGILNNTFQRMFEKMTHDLKNPPNYKNPINASHFIYSVEVLINLNVDFGYHYLTALQTFWPDFFAPETLLSRMVTAHEVNDNASLIN
jgi:hypothetical protein